MLQNPITIQLQQPQSNYNPITILQNPITILQNPITIQLQFNYNKPNPITIHLQ
jgi:hypothetical protein